MLIFYVSLIFQETGIYLTDKIYMDLYINNTINIIYNEIWTPKYASH